MKRENSGILCDLLIDNIARIDTRNPKSSKSACLNALLSAECWRGYIFHGFSISVRGCIRQGAAWSALKKRVYISFRPGPY